MLARGRSRRRGTALLQVLILLLVSITLVALLLTANSSLTKQTKAHQENTVVRNEGRGAIHLVAALLDREIQAGTPLVPLPVAAPAGAWVGTGTATDPYYLVFFGSLRHRPTGDAVTTPLRPWCELDTAQTYYTFVTGSALGTSVTTDAWVSGARNFLRDAPASDLTYLARVEYKESPTGEFYYHTRTVTRVVGSGVVGDATSAGVGVGLKPTVLVAQAALVAEIPTPWGYAGFRGNAAVRVVDDGTVRSSAGAGNTSPVLASNGTIGR